MSDLARGILDDRGRQIVDNLNLGRPFVCQRVSVSGKFDIVNSNKLNSKS